LKEDSVDESVQYAFQKDEDGDAQGISAQEPSVGNVLEEFGQPVGIIIVEAESEHQAGMEY
jgi:hypothetical protein